MRCGPDVFTTWTMDIRADRAIVGVDLLGCRAILLAVLQNMRVHLKSWIVADGEIPPVAVGDVVELGLGVDTEFPPVPAPSSRPDGIMLLPEVPDSGARSYAEICGPLTVARDSDGEAAGVIVSIDGVIDLIVLGYPTADQSLELIDESLDGRRVLIRGDVVVEPYLWFPGIFRSSAPHGPVWWIVERIRSTGSDERGIRCGSVLLDVPTTDPHDMMQADYLVDLRIQEHS